MNNCEKLIGKTKKEILEEMGDSFNFFESSVWTFVIKKKWFAVNQVLFIYFECEIASDLKIIKI